MEQFLVREDIVVEQLSIELEHLDSTLSMLGLIGFETKENVFTEQVDCLDYNVWVVTIEEGQ